MFDHVLIRASDRGATERFYRTVLGTLGIEPSTESDAITAWQDFTVVGTSPGKPPTRHLHVGFVAPTREHVDAFWQRGVDAGYEDAGAPGERRQYRSDYYGAFLLDPDGNSAEAVHHSDTRRGGHIDHLWIGVADLETAAAFYRTIARHTGLREGRGWEQGVQFQGAWATMSLVSDGRPPTEDLHLAFPAPDQSTVADFHSAAVAAGYRSNGEPGLRPRYHRSYYAAFVLDPDGTNVESVNHGPLAIEVSAEQS